MSTTNGHHDQTTSLPTFTPIREPSKRQHSYHSRVASSEASSSRSAVERSHTRSENDGHGTNGGSNILWKDQMIKDDEADRLPQQNNTIRRTKRASGGFLLDTSPPSSRLSRSIHPPKDIKGKEKTGAHGSPIPRQRVQLDGHDSRSSQRISSHTSDVQPDTLHPDRLSFDPNVAGLDSYDFQQSGLTESCSSAPSGQRNPSYGFDTDPTQIVEMALRLNEGRRRQRSARRLVSTPIEPRRVVSTAVSSPLRSFSTAQRNPGLHTSEVASASLGQQDSSPEQDLDNLSDDMQISRATQNRVNKAKAYFELAYEHRRLLSHLPPLRSPDVNFDPQKPGYDSRSYNPLQYCRNRKLRFRERQPRNSEGEGWHDVLKVRAWVDAVISSHFETRHDPRECVRLPPLTLHDKDDQDEEEWKAKAATNGKPRRPKSDWVTHPGDMLADQWWTEQGLNKQKIYNCNNEPIFPPGTKFRFSGWRNRTPVDVPEELKSSSPELSPTIDRKDSIPAPPDLPVFESAHKDHGWGRARSKFGHALNKKSQNAKQKVGDIFDTSSEPSSSDGERRQSRGRKRLTKRHEKFDIPEGDPFAHVVQPKLVAHEATSSLNSSKRGSRHDSIDHANPSKKHHRDGPLIRSEHVEDEKHRLGKRRAFLSNIKLDSDNERGRSSFDYESTAPPTPAIPSIAINLSPPVSRSPSPGTKHKNSFFSVVKDKIPGVRDRVDHTDFAADISSHGSTDRSHSRPHIFDVSRGTSPMSGNVGRGTSPFTRYRTRASIDESSLSTADPHSSTLSKASTRTTQATAQRPHRVRGIFKGGRIAELVGNEVSRVGDFIWKREPPRRSDMTEEGSTSGYESESDELTDQVDQESKAATQLDRHHAQRSPTGRQAATPGSPAASPETRGLPQYHIQGLPNFTSPFQRDRDEQDRKKRPRSPGGTPRISEPAGVNDEIDPVSTGAAARRADKSPRFGRLAPPKLDIQAATPDGRRRGSYGFGTALNLNRTRSASDIFNNAIGGESAHSKSPSYSRPSSQSRFHSRPGAELRRTDSREYGGRTGNPVMVSDVHRVHSLLVTLAIKATNIADLCDAVPNPQSQFLYSAFRSTGATSEEIRKHFPIRRRDEHFVAGQHLVSHLGKQGNIFNDRLTHFTSHISNNLHKEIQILEDKADSALFPRLQKLSDTAGQLAQKLTTTSTLAVKSVNDEVSEAMRLKRRGTIRFSRWLGYKLMEIGVVSALWLIWFVVTVIRFALGTIRGVWAVVAWLFWLR
ncbi:hypothetical protein LTS08_006929 [Lithohypha guttulata]|nr:hypothetical protein LTS08_006929 [Lithohypha guttulata]